MGAEFTVPDVSRFMGSYGRGNGSRAALRETLRTVGVETQEHARRLIDQLQQPEFADGIKAAADAVHPSRTEHLSARDIAHTTANLVADVMDLEGWQPLPVEADIASEIELKD